MKLTHEDHDQLTVLTVKGELEAAEADRFRKAALERMEAKVRLAAVKDHVFSILEMTRLASRFDCHDSVDGAVRSLMQ